MSKAFSHLLLWHWRKYRNIPDRERRLGEKGQVWILTKWLSGGQLSLESRARASQAWQSVDEGWAGRGGDQSLRSRRAREPRSGHLLVRASWPEQLLHTGCRIM